MYKVGVTGGIGSGKSLICHVFATFGIPVYDADIRARYIMEHDHRLILSLKNVFGDNIYSQDKLNNQELAGIVFSDKEALHQLNSFVHPLVRQDFINWISIQHDCPYVIQETAILFESGASKLMDLIVSVSAPEELRIQRIINRSNMRREEVLARMRNQMDQDEIDRKADAIINNDEEHLVIPQILNFHEKILRKQLFL